MPERAILPTLDDLAKGRVTLDEYEIAHGEDVPELTEEVMSRARPMRETFPEIVEAFETMQGKRGPQKAPVKERIGLRLDPRVIEHFRSTGPGWQSRINDVLSNYVAASQK